MQRGQMNLALIPPEQRQAYLAQLSQHGVQERNPAPKRRPSGVPRKCNNISCDKIVTKRNYCYKCQKRKERGRSINPRLPSVKQLLLPTKKSKTTEPKTTALEPQSPTPELPSSPMSFASSPVPSPGAPLPSMGAPSAMMYQPLQPSQNPVDLLYAHSLLLAHGDEDAAANLVHQLSASLSRLQLQKKQFIQQHQQAQMQGQGPMQLSQDQAAGPWGSRDLQGAVEAMHAMQFGHNN
mmetsp:Transcript_19501/g.74839  ORF Transcript_19501/g.74839 Transcript_19501/m.74839 type:complete len:237 (-) Transcript_19501:46-756(-)